MKGSREVAAHFAATLRRVRKEADLSQEALGLRASLHRTEIGLLERGARIPRIDTIIKLAAALEVPAKHLLDGIEWTPTTTEGGGFTFKSHAERHAETRSATRGTRPAGKVAPDGRRDQEATERTLSCAICHLVGHGR